MAINKGSIVLIYKGSIVLIYCSQPRILAQFYLGHVRLPAQNTNFPVWCVASFALLFCRLFSPLSKAMFLTVKPDWKVCLARPISLPRTLNFSRGSSREIFVKQQKETIELLFSDTNTAVQEIWMQERSPAHSANFPIWQSRRILASVLGSFCSKSSQFNITFLAKTGSSTCASLMAKTLCHKKFKTVRSFKTETAMDINRHQKDYEGLLQSQCIVYILEPAICKSKCIGN